MTFSSPSFLRRFDETLHAAEIRGGGGLTGVHARLRLFLPAVLLGRCAADQTGEQEDRCGRGRHASCEYFIAEPSDGQEATQWRGDDDTGSRR